MVKPLWRIADLIDLHYFFQADETLRQREGESVLAKRDRIIFLAKIEPQLGKADEIPPRLLVRKWLAIRRLQYTQEKGQEGQVLPGTVWQELTALGRGLFFFAGILAGAGLAGTFLIYSGAAPLNVATYFGLFVLLQLLFLGLQSIFLLYRRVRRLPMESSVLYVFLGRLLIKGLDGVRRRLQRSLTGRQRLDLAALAGGVQQRKELAALLIWPAFLLVQLGGVGFNLGVIGVTLAKVAFADIAFGWQSSLQLSAEAVARLVQWIALPWTWAVAPAYPSLAQIEGSQIILKEGITHLTTGALVSWWPFLCSAVVVYGLLPRVVLLVLGLVQQQRALERLHFATLEIRPLLLRMAAPRIDTNGVTEKIRTRQSQSSSVDLGAASGPKVGMPALDAVSGKTSWWVLIPDELYEDCPLPSLLALLRPQIDAASVQWLRIGMPGTMATDILAPLPDTAEKLAGVVLLQEAWQPPLRETESLLRQLRQRIGATVPLTLALIGRPTRQTVLTPVTSEQLLIWNQKMQAIGDPCLYVGSLVQP
jgi:hypothetical protein